MNTKHKQDCKMVFGRKDASCDRCKELIGGASARDAWQKDHYSMKKNNAHVEQISRENHRKTCPICVMGQPGVCTFGES